MNQGMGRFSHLLHGEVEGCFVGFRGLVEAAQLAHELQGRSTNLLVRCRRLEVEQRLDISAHGRLQEKDSTVTPCVAASCGSPRCDIALRPMKTLPHVDPGD
jgi:hypothetical protein